MNLPLLFLQLIRIKGPISRTELGEISKLSLTTVGRIVDSLIEEELIAEVGTTGVGRGRKSNLLDINSFGRFAIGIDIDVNRISAGITDLNGNIILRRNAPLPEQPSPETVVQIVLRLTKEILSSVDTKTEKKVLGLGISLPGSIEWSEGIIKISPQFHWTNVPFKEMITRKYAKPVYIDNNVKATAASEILFGFGKKYSNFVVLHCGSGVGAAVVNNRNIERGINNMSGEVGHLVVSPTGHLCDCGRHGCLQTYICKSALEIKAGKSYANIWESAKKGNMFCSLLLDESNLYLSMLIANIVNMYDPPIILLGGEIFDNSIELVEKVIYKAKSLMPHHLDKKPKIKKTTFNYNDNVILAASSLVIQHKIFE